jgi:Tfp pilus assembly protein PilN
MLYAKCLGILIEADTLRLALVQREFKGVRLLDLLTLKNFRSSPPQELKSAILRFLAKHQAQKARAVLLLPRQEVVLRQLELPAEAAANLPKVVEFQLAGLLPAETPEIVYAYHVSKSKSGSSPLGLSIYLVPKGTLEDPLHWCDLLDLRIFRVVPTSVALANLFLGQVPGLKSGSGLIGYRTAQGCEWIFLRQGSPIQAYFQAMEEESDFPAVLEREGERMRSRIGLAEEVPLDLYLAGAQDPAGIPADRHFRIHSLAQPADFRLLLGTLVIDRRQLAETLPAIAGALCGLQRRNPVHVDLLPAERQKKHAQWMLIPTYALAAANLLLLILLALRGPLQQSWYASRLEAEVTRLEPEVKKMKRVEERKKDFERRIALLANARRTNERILEALKELSSILPKEAWVMDLTLRNNAIEIYGISDSAATLPQLIDNSPRFRGAEFVAPIARDSNGKEVYRIRLQLE